MPLPAVIRCTSPAGMTLRVPRLSRCSTLPSSTYVMISMSRCGWVPNPFPGATWSSLMTRSTENPFSFGSKYSPNENVCRLFSQSIFVSPRSEAFRRVIILFSLDSALLCLGSACCSPPSGLNTMLLSPRLDQAARDLRDVPSLELRDLQFVPARLTTAVGVRQRCRAVRRAAGDLAHVRHANRRIRNPDDDHAEMEQRRMKTGDGGFLAAVLSSAAREDA